MRKPVLSTLLLLFFSSSFAQQRNAAFNITLGPSFPSGTYGKKDFGNQTSGFARTGQAAQVSYTYVFNNHFGVIAALHGQQNSLNTKALEHLYANANLNQGVYIGTTPGQQPPATPHTTYPNWQFDKSAWRLGSLLAGGVAQFTVAKKTTFTAKTMIGVAYAASPKLNGHSITDTATATVQQSRGTGLGFAYTMGGGIQHQLSKKIHLLTHFDYFGTTAILFKNITTTVITTKNNNGASVQQRTSTSDMQQRISSLNLQAGLGIRL